MQFRISNPLQKYDRKGAILGIGSIQFLTNEIFTCFGVQCTSINLSTDYTERERERTYQATEADNCEVEVSGLILLKS